MKEISAETIKQFLDWLQELEKINPEHELLISGTYRYAEGILKLFNKWVEIEGNYL